MRSESGSEWASHLLCLAGLPFRLFGGGVVRSLFLEPTRIGRDVLFRIRGNLAKDLSKN